MNSRIKQIRKDAGLTQTEFANRLGLSQNYIAQIECNSRCPSDRTAADICKIFNVNEEWLRTGRGEMYAPVDDEVAAIVSNLLEESNPMYDLVLRIARNYSMLDDKRRKVVDDFVKTLFKEQ